MNESTTPVMGESPSYMRSFKEEIDKVQDFSQVVAAIVKTVDTTSEITDEHVTAEAINNLYAISIERHEIFTALTGMSGLLSRFSKFAIKLNSISIKGENEDFYI